MTAVQYSCPKSVKACALRMTFLEPSGLTQDPLTPERTVQGSGFVELALNPDYESPSEVVVRNPGSTVAVIHKDFDVLKGFEVSLKLCGINLVTALLGWTGFTSYDEATDTTSVNGWALNDDLGRPCVVQPAMLEVWSKNVADTGHHRGRLREVGALGTAVDPRLDAGVQHYVRYRTSGDRTERLRTSEPVVVSRVPRHRLPLL